MTSRASRSVMSHLVVLSHLRWDWVWQRPQHLVSRFAAQRRAAGAHTWFVEEPLLGNVPRPVIETRDVSSDITRVWLVLPRCWRRDSPPGFDSPGSHEYGKLLQELLECAGVKRPEVLLYSPMALHIAQTLKPTRLFYDVMDDLASFRAAPEGLVLQHRRALREASLVFAGGRTLHRDAARHRNGATILVPSGVETSHFATALALRNTQGQPVAGYVGVIDERLDLDLVAALSQQLPEWTIRLVGPVAKIDEADVPRRDNIEHLGMVSYAELPRILADVNVALMPFALNEATRSISPTKTLEYLAAGLPVVSTRVPDVVADHALTVTLADDASSFARACRLLLNETSEHHEVRARKVSREHEWDVIAYRMSSVMSGALSAAQVSGTSP